MRLLILAAGASLVLTACGNNDQSGNTASVDNLTAESIVSNDVTAIDAVTGAAANMAADVQYTPDANDMLANDSNTAAPPASRPRPKTTSSSPKPARPEPATEPAANTTE